MKHDIKNRNDIELLVNQFYDKVKNEKKLMHYFTDIVQVDWEKHIAYMTNFLDNILFYTENYKGNPYTTHFKLSKKSTIGNKEYNTWIKLFNETVDELFIGDRANLIKQRVLNISNIIISVR